MAILLKTLQPDRAVEIDRLLAEAEIVPVALSEGKEPNDEPNPEPLGAR